MTGRVDFSQMSTQGELVDTLHNLHSWLQVFEKIVDFKDVDTAFSQKFLWKNLDQPTMSCLVEM